MSVPKGAISAESKQDAINQCLRFKQYYPYRYAAIIDTGESWVWCNGKTMSRINRLAKEFPGKVFLISNKEG